MGSEAILTVNDLTTVFHTERGDFTAISGVSFSIMRGERVGIVGESGCGKSVTSQSVLRLYDESREVSYKGSVCLDGKELLTLPPKKMDSIRGREIAMVFQDALSTLNPVFSVGYQIREPLKVHLKMKGDEAEKRALELLKLVGIPEPGERMRQYPHELSGGMRQRVMIAIALACQPKLLIADEPTTALDVTIQKQIMNLILELNRKLDMGIMLITHDLAVISETCQRVLVMYLGQIVEEAPVDRLFERPLHPYTKSLIASIPKIGDKSKSPLPVIPGSVPFLSEIPKGCRFSPRCKYATERCREEMPELTEKDGQQVRCHMAGEL